MNESLTPPERRRKNIESGKISHQETERFDREGFYGLRYLNDDEGAGFGALEVHVQTAHPEKTVQVKTRMYRVEEGSGTFVIDGKTHEAAPGDMFLIRQNSTYSYQGRMKLFEINIPLDNSS
jgi:mannose-6-phosphate isomerase-like protein (cupin superfamily)